MPGQVVEYEGKRGRSYSIRFQAYGKRRFITLGNDRDGWTRARAEQELQDVLSDVRRGLWREAAPPPIVVEPKDPTFHEFASEWMAAIRGEIRKTTADNYAWQLVHHLLPYFAKHRLSQITVQEVDRYRHRKVAEGRLGPKSINETIARLAQILDVAVEYEILERNPAVGRKRRLKAARPRPVHLDAAEQIAALLDAAGDLDAGSNARTAGRRPFVATLVFGGLRIGEACQLRWRDVDLANGRLRVGEAKTDAGVREVDLLPVLRDELAAHKVNAARSTGANDIVFATSNGTPRDKDNARARVIRPVVEHADELLEERGHQPLPSGVTAHKLRHTYASILLALGGDSSYVMGQLGHTDPRFTLRVYTHQMRRGDGERAALARLVGAEIEAKGGRNSPLRSSRPFSRP